MRKWLESFCHLGSLKKERAGTFLVFLLLLWLSLASQRPQTLVIVGCGSILTFCLDSFNFCPQRGQVLEQNSWRAVVSWSLREEQSSPSPVGALESYSLLKMVMNARICFPALTKFWGQIRGKLKAHAHDRQRTQAAWIQSSGSSG